MKTVVAQSINAIVKDHLFVSTILFTKGDNYLIYPWTLSNDSANSECPDNTAFNEIGDILVREGESNQILLNQKLKLKHDLTSLVGNFENWMYAGSWEADKISQCQDNINFSSSISANYTHNQLRVLSFVAQISKKAKPSQQELGNEWGVFNQDSLSNFGYVTRNLKLSIAMADLTAPYIKFISAQRNLTNFKFTWQVKGCIKVFSTHIWWFNTRPSTEINMGLKYQGPGFWSDPDFFFEENLNIENENLSDITFGINATCDTHFFNQEKPEPDTDPQSHFVKIRIDPNYYVQNNNFSLLSYQELSLIYSENDLPMTHLNDDTTTTFLDKDASTSTLDKNESLPILDQNESMDKDNTSEPVVNFNNTINQSKDMEEVTFNNISLEFINKEMILCPGSDLNVSPELTIQIVNINNSFCYVSVVVSKINLSSFLDSHWTMQLYKSGNVLNCMHDRLGPPKSYNFVTSLPLTPDYNNDVLHFEKMISSFMFKIEEIAWGSLGLLRNSSLISAFLLEFDFLPIQDKSKAICVVEELNLFYLEIHLGQIFHRHTNNSYTLEFTPQTGNYYVKFNSYKKDGTDDNSTISIFKGNEKVVFGVIQNNSLIITSLNPSSMDLMFGNRLAVIYENSSTSLNKSCTIVQSLTYNVFPEDTNNNLSIKKSTKMTENNTKLVLFTILISLASIFVIFIICIFLYQKGKNWIGKFNRKKVGFKFENLKNYGSKEEKVTKIEFIDH